MQPTNQPTTMKLAESEITAIVESVISEIARSPLPESLVSDAYLVANESNSGTYPNAGRIENSVRDFFREACTFKPYGQKNGMWSWDESLINA